MEYTNELPAWLALEKHCSGHKEKTLARIF